MKAHTDGGFYIMSVRASQIIEAAKRCFHVDVAALEIVYDRSGQPWHTLSIKRRHERWKVIATRASRAELLDWVNSHDVGPVESGRTIANGM